VIESIKKDTVAAMCIQTPFAQTRTWKGRFSKLFSTHPPIEDRIKALESY
jgi:Zn-dependent protease with chaperone function